MKADLVRNMHRLVILVLGMSVAAQCFPAIAQTVAPVDSALALCRQADQLPTSEQAQVLEQGLVLAEIAVAAEPANAHAHFAVFCTLGKQLRLRGYSLGILLAVGRVKQAIDRALALKPDEAEFLTAKGVLLLSLPKLLGGDVAQGKRLLDEALRLDPSNCEARRYREQAPPSV